MGEKRKMFSYRKTFTCATEQVCFDLDLVTKWEIGIKDISLFVISLAWHNGFKLKREIARVTIYRGGTVHIIFINVLIGPILHI